MAAAVLFVVAVAGVLSVPVLNAMSASSSGSVDRPVPRVEIHTVIPVATAKTHFVEVADYRFRAYSGSAPVEQGQAYRFTLYTHCGIDGAVDFDGSMWDFAGPGRGGGISSPKGFGNPFDEGTMTLVETDRARYESSEGVVVKFERHRGPKLVPGCE